MEAIVIIVLIVIFLFNSITIAGLRKELRKTTKDKNWYESIFKDKYTNDGEI